MSDGRVVAATARVVPIMVDASNRENPPRAVRQMFDKYGVRGIPALILVNANGDVVEVIEEREPSALAAKIAGPSTATAAEANAGVARGSSAAMLVLILGGGVVLIGVLGLILWKLGWFSSEE